MTDTTELTTDAPAPEEAPAAAPAEPVATQEVVADEVTALGSKVDDETEVSAEAEAPVIPEAYQLTAPEGMSLDAEILAEATPVFKEIGLTNETANKLMPFAGKLVEKTQEATLAQITEQGAAQRKAWLDAAKGAEDIGGNKWDATLGVASRGLDALGYVAGSPFRQFLEETGIGNHPDMIRIAAKLGELAGEEGNFARSDAGAPVDVLSEMYPNNRRSK